MLFAVTARPLGLEAAPGVFWRGLRLLAVDGTCWDVADTVANEREFGRPGTTRPVGKAAFPQVRMAALVEVGTHAVLDAEVAGCRTGEVTLVARLVRSCGPGRLLLADREFLGAPLWQSFTTTGCHLLWRVPANRVLPVQHRLPDGSWLSRIHARDDGKKIHPVRVRVISYRLDGAPGAEAGGYRLVTDLLDAEQYPGRELAGLYRERWEIESVLGEIKTRQRGAKVVLPSKTPDGVRQQTWAHLLVHHALRELMAKTATVRGIHPDRLSFTDTLRAARRSVTTTPGVFSPWAAGHRTRKAPRRPPRPAPAAPTDPQPAPCRQTQDVQLPTQMGRTPHLAPARQSPDRRHHHPPTVTPVTQRHCS